MKKNIFIVKFENVVDMDKIDDNINAFENEQDAQAFFNELVETTKNENANEIKDWEKEEDEKSFSTYPEGYYLDNHIDITLTAIPLN